MANGCCQLVGNFELNIGGCIVSVNISSSTESSRVEDVFIVGQTIGTLSLSGYAQDDIHVGCPGKAGVSIPWIRKWDCDNNQTYFIHAGAGKSFIAGDINNLATLKNTIGSYNTMSASSSAGPAAIYMRTTQTDGYGLAYTGDPIPFSDSEGFILSGLDIGVGPLYLQSFNLECNPGSIPTASYSFVFVGTFEY